MQRAEEATYASLERLKRELIEPSLSRHEGRLIKTTGDGALAEFASPSAAVRCAVEIQESIAGGDSRSRWHSDFGEGVQRSRRQAGGWSRGPGRTAAQEHLQAVCVFAVRAGAHGALIDRLSAAPPLPDKPSIAVLPFGNMSGDPEQEYFADGMVEEIITALSRFKWLFVIARNSSFTFKSRAIDIKEVGRRLGVRYVLEGSVRKAAGKVRITGQLIDALTGAHIWADRFERDLTDVFALQDELTIAVVSAIQPSLMQAEFEKAARRPPENLTAYDLLLRARQKSYLITREGIAETAELAQRALDLDPRSSFAAVLAGERAPQQLYFRVCCRSSIRPQRSKAANSLGIEP